MAVKEKFSPVDEIHAENQDCRGCRNKPFSRNGAGEASASEGGKGENGQFLKGCPIPGDGRGLHRLEQQVAALKTENDYLTRTCAAVVESEREYHHFFQSTREAILVFDRDMRLLKANPASVRLFGYSRISDIRNMCLDNMFLDPGILDGLLKALLFEGSIGDFETVLCCDHPNERRPVVIGSGFVHFDDKGQLKHFEFVLTDITERKKLEAQLFQVQKIEAVGTLAGGVAHDFNNLLMGIQGRSSLISMDLPPAHPHLEHTNAIETHIQSAKMLTDQLVGFARGGKYQVMPTDMNELAHKSTALFGRTKKELRIHMKSGAEPMVADADRNQMEQVLLNLLINSWQAMPHGGEIFVECGMETVDKQFCRSRRIEPGPYVRIRMTDTGIGMDQATQKRIFDPFFTTKKRGRGTGLGLASAYGIIKNHGGVITVESEPGHGATFNILLPASKNKAVRVPLMKAKPVRGCENILLVDDEAHVLEVSRAVLERLGYGVVAANGGRQAVQTVETKGREIDLVLLDMLMPDMDGGETFAHIRKLAPEMRVLFCSGHALGEKMNRLMNHTSHCGFIQKPFTIPALSENIRKMLDGSDSKKVIA
ncbi:MAG: response regulator [Deltaproteobacteria bacterium]|nr:response regulator [Deltaproteobacteria bacterium]